MQLEKGVSQADKSSNAVMSPVCRNAQNMEIIRTVTLWLGAAPLRAKTSTSERTESQALSAALLFFHIYGLESWKVWYRRRCSLRFVMRFGLDGFGWRYGESRKQVEIFVR